MEISRKWRFSCLLLGLFFLATTLQGVQGEVELGPSESECRPYIEKALKELETAETEPVDPGTPTTEETENAPVLESTLDDSEHETSAGEDDTDKGDNTESTEAQQEEHETSTETQEQDGEQSKEGSEEKSGEEANKEQSDETVTEETPEEEQNQESLEQNDEPAQSQEAQATSQELQVESEEAQGESQEAVAESQEAQADSVEASQENAVESQEVPVESQEAHVESQEAPAESQEAPGESQEAPAESQEVPAESQEVPQEEAGSQEAAQSTEVEIGAESVESAEQQTDSELPEAEPTESIEKTDDAASVEKTEEDIAASTETAESVEKVDEEATETEETKEASVEEVEAVEELQAHEPATKIQEEQEVKEVEESETKAQTEEVKDETEKEGEEVKDSEKEGEELKEGEGKEEETKEGEEMKEGEVVEVDKEGVEGVETPEGGEKSEEAAKETTEGEESQTEEGTKEAVPEEDLILEIEIPENLRPRDQVDQLLKLDDSNSEVEAVVNNVAQVTLKELKRLYENAIKPLETLYKYRDLSNRHFGDSEIFSKPLVLFMGPWSGGKSSIINYLLDNEYNTTSLRTGAEPSPAYFNLLMYGDEPEVLDGTQLAADFTFAGLQKFGQGLEERLRGLKLPSKLLEKINIVEIPGILEVRKQVSRVFPFNDACQWFIDRADIIFLVYDPSKLDVGPETEAILDQLKGREHQTRIILNKADQVKPEELMRVQGALIWNISPLMSSAQPPVMYTTSLWSRPYESWAPVRLLQAQERAFLRDLRSAVDKRIENKISSARRFAVRVRNHAKMVDCYLTTYYNHKSVFGNRKQVSDQIIEHPQDYHIYEGLSTLTNISRYDLPDPDVYRDFFRLNPLYDFQQLSATCTYFRGCPINRLDVAIAYDLPELVGKHKKLIEAAVSEIKTES